MPRPACPPCAINEQYYAHPSRRFDEGYRNGFLSSICRNDYSEFMGLMARQIAARLCP